MYWYCQRVPLADTSSSEAILSNIESRMYWKQVVKYERSSASTQSRRYHGMLCWHQSSPRLNMTLTRRNPTASHSVVFGSIRRNHSSSLLVSTTPDCSTFRPILCTKPDPHIGGGRHNGVSIDRVKNASIWCVWLVIRQTQADTCNGIIGNHFPRWWYLEFISSWTHISFHTISASGVPLSPSRADSLFGVSRCNGR